MLVPIDISPVGRKRRHLPRVLGMYFLRAKTVINIDYPITLNSYMVDVDSTVTETSRAVRVVVMDRGVEKAGREEEEMAEAVGPSRLKHWADEASVKRGRGRGSFECASTIHSPSDHRFCCKIPPLHVLAHT